jgi:hypothetical protein
MMRRQIFWLQRLNSGMTSAGWQRVCLAQCKRWGDAGLGVVLGLTAVLWLASDVGLAREQAEQAVHTAKVRLHAQLPPPPHPADLSVQASHALWPRLNGGFSTEIWPHLQQALGAQGVRVESIRVLPDVGAGPLQSQSVALRLMALYPDWVSAWRWLTDAGPVLSLDRISIAPQAASQGVQLDVVLRLWFKPGSVEGVFAEGWSRVPTAAVHSKANAALPPGIFAHPGTSANARHVLPRTGAQPVQPTTDPLQWPMEKIRLLGTWQQGARWQAVLGAAGAGRPVQVGQRVALEGHWVESIRSDAVVLRSVQGQSIELTWSGGAR